MVRTILTATFVFIGLGSLFAQEEPGGPQDHTVSPDERLLKSGLLQPKEYADYLIASNTLSPDGKFAVMYPKAGLCSDEPKKKAANRCKDYLVALQPFQVLAALDTEWPEFEHKNPGGLSAAWLTDGSAVLVTLDSRWGPGDIFLYEIHDGKLSRSTNLLRKVHDLLVADYKKALPTRDNDSFDFVFKPEYDVPVCQFAGSSEVRIRVTATTDPKETPGTKAWDGAAEVTWNIPKAKFTSQKVTRKFAGIRSNFPKRSISK